MYKRQVGNLSVKKIGKREKNVWDNDPEGIYIPLDEVAEIKCLTEKGEGFIAGAKYNQKLKPFMVTQDEIDIVQYGSDDTKTHRKIKHILGQKQSKSVGRLLVSELYTVGQGGWSGFPPHKHDTDRLPDETKFEEVYQFRFNPSNGFGAQFLYPDQNSLGPIYHVKDGSTILINKGYHPSVAAPGYQMYYFTIIVGKTHRSLIQFFEPSHSYQLEIIPGIKNMIDNFK